MSDAGNGVNIWFAESVESNGQNSDSDLMFDELIFV